VWQETLRIPRKSPDLLHPLRDRRSLESRTRDTQIPYPLIHLVELATLRLLAVHNGRIGITFHSSSTSARRLILTPTVAIHHGRLIERPGARMEPKARPRMLRSACTTRHRLVRCRGMHEMVEAHLRGQLGEEQ
jgi:hypothetical protein